MFIDRKTELARGPDMITPSEQRALLRILQTVRQRAASGVLGGSRAQGRLVCLLPQVCVE